MGDIACYCRVSTKDQNLSRQAENGPRSERLEVAIEFPVGDVDAELVVLLGLGLDEVGVDVLTQRVLDGLVRFEGVEGLPEVGGERIDAVLLAFLLVEVVDVLPDRIGAVEVVLDAVQTRRVTPTSRWRS